MSPLARVTSCPFLQPLTLPVAPQQETYFALLSLIIFCGLDSCQKGHLGVIILDVRQTMSALGRSSSSPFLAIPPAHPLISGNRRIDLWPPPPHQSDRRAAGDYLVNIIDMLALCWSLPLDGPVGQHPCLHMDSHMHTHTCARKRLSTSPLLTCLIVGIFSPGFGEGLVGQEASWWKAWTCEKANQHIAQLWKIQSDLWKEREKKKNY